MPDNYVMRLKDDRGGGANRPPQYAPKESKLENAVLNGLLALPEAISAGPLWGTGLLLGNALESMYGKSPAGPNGEQVFMGTAAPKGKKQAAGKAVDMVKASGKAENATEKAKGIIRGFLSLEEPVRRTTLKSEVGQDMAEALREELLKKGLHAGKPSTASTGSVYMGVADSASPAEGRWTQVRIADHPARNPVTSNPRVEFSSNHDFAPGPAADLEIGRAHV